MSEPKPKKVTITQYFCKHCKNYWTPEDEPRRCGICKTPNWDKPKRESVGRPTLGLSIQELRLRWKANRKAKVAAEREAQGLPPLVPRAPGKPKAPLDISWLDDHA